MSLVGSVEGTVEVVVDGAVKGGTERVGGVDAGCGDEDCCCSGG